MASLSKMVKQRVCLERGFLRLVFIFGIVGLAPFGVNPKLGCLRSTPKLVWSIILLISLPMAFFFFAIAHISDDAKSSVIRRLARLGGYVELQLVFAIMLFAVLNRKKMMKYIDSIVFFDRYLASQRVNFDLASTRKWGFADRVLALFVLFLVIFLGNQYLRHGLESYVDIFFYLCYFFSYSVCHLVLIQYCAMVILLKHRFQVLNCKLGDIGRGFFNKPVTVTKIWSGVNGKKGETVEALHILSNAYHLLWSSSDFLNGIFAPVLVLSLLSSTIWLITLGYVLLTALEAGKAGSVSVPTMAWIVLELAIAILGPVWAASTTKKEASKISKKLYKLGHLADDYLAKVTNFSLQLIHETVSFNAFGLFDIDEKLLQAVFATVCSYLVIILQFEISNANHSDDPIV